MNWLIDFVRRVWNAIFGGGNSPVKIGDHCFMPLFYRNLTGGIDMTWNYLSKSDSEKQHLRNYIKANSTSDETPTIAFCLTPQSINGGLVDDKMLAVTDGMLDYLEAKCKELVKDGVAVFPCLYVDDLVPRWYFIEQHQAIWRRIHDRIKNYVTGYILSIETNEEANNVGQLQGCIEVMRVAMPDAAFYGTHLQFRANNGRYTWQGGASTPQNANIILVEYSWNPHRGDAAGVDGLQREFAAIMGASPNLKMVHHEYNVQFDSAVGNAQREMLRAWGAWGVA